MLCYKILVIFILFSSTCLAKTEEVNDIRLLKPEKITVGPYDNYQGSLSLDGKLLFYTQSRNATSRIYFLNLQTKEGGALTPQKADAKDPCYQTQTKQLAFTYYLKNATGDICLLYKKSKIKCITNDPHIYFSNPFWINEKTLGYFSQNNKGEEFLLKHNLEDGKVETLLSGSFSAPSISPDQNFLVLTEKNKQEKSEHLVLYSLKEKKIIRTIDFDIPGFSAYSNFSPDGKNLYFSHYLNDTNFDGIVDGNDNSVVFQVPFETLMQTGLKKTIPFQLTTMEQNCNFPLVAHDSFYVTCAFGNSLDIYKFDKNGVLPQSWTQDDIQHHIRSARSYSNRLFLLSHVNHLEDEDNIETIEKILSDHLMLDSFMSSYFYLDKVIDYYSDKKQVKRTNFYQIFKKYLQLTEKFKLNKSFFLSPYLSTQMIKTINELQQISGWSEFKKILTALIKLKAKQPNEAQILFDSLEFTKLTSPLELYYYISLVQSIALKSKVIYHSSYTQMIESPLLDDRSRLFYLYEYLDLIDGATQDFSLKRERVHQLLALKNLLPKHMSLLELEKLTYDFLQESDDSQKKNILNNIYLKTKEYQGDYPFLAQIYSRLIKTLLKYKDYDYIAVFSTNWLTFISDHDLAERSFALDQYRKVTMTEAYHAHGNHDYDYATKLFYMSLRQTDDLQAHFEYIKSSVSYDNERLERDYQFLLDRNIVSQTSFQYGKIIEKLERLLLNEATSVKDSFYENLIDETKKLSEKVVNPCMKQILLAYAFHNRLLLSKKGFSYNKDFLLNAHRYYLLALDLSEKNDRLVTPILMNLSLLHWDVKNYGLSLNFITKRLEFSFVHSEEKLYVKWIYARLLFYTNQKSKSYYTLLDELEDLNKITNQSLKKVFYERLAFYAYASENYEESLKYYEILMNQFGSEIDINNLFKINVARAYCHIKLNHISEAKALLNLVEQQVKNSKSYDSSSFDYLDYEPRRILLIVYGLLDEIASGDEDSLVFRKKHLTTLESFSKDYKKLGWQEDRLLSLVIKDKLRILSLTKKMKQQVSESTFFLEVFQLAKRWAQIRENDYSGVVFYNTLNETLSYLLIENKEASFVDPILSQLKSLFNLYLKKSDDKPKSYAKELKLSLYYNFTLYKYDKIAKEDLGKNLETLLEKKRTQEFFAVKSKESQEVKEIFYLLLEAFSQGRERNTLVKLKREVNKKLFI